MNRKIATIALAVLAAPMAFSNTPLLENPNFVGWTPWNIGSNKFQPKTTWLAFVQAPTAYSYESRLAPAGNGFTFTSWDDGTSDRIETYLYQEWKAGPAGGSFAPSHFATGDVIVFKGSAKSTKVGANTADMTVRAFIKVLGYNPWEFQTLLEYSAFHPIGSAMEAFEISTTFPDLAVDDRLQVLQVGFEISTEYDGSAMDSGTITFENIEAYVVGDEPTWAGYPVRPDGYADTGSWLGWVYVADAPWIWSVSLNNYAYIPEEAVTAGGGWAYVMGQ